MCYKRPGPRCSWHAKKKMNEARVTLDLATKALDEAVALDEGVEEAQEAHAQALSRYNEATREFYTTPAGFEVLQKKIDDAREDDKDSELIARMESKLEKLKSQREEALAAIGVKETADEQMVFVESEVGLDNTVTEEFSRCDACGQFAGSEHICASGAYNTDDVTTWSPAQVDDKIAEHMYESYKLQDQLARKQKFYSDYENMTKPTYRYYRESEVERYREKMQQLSAEMEELRHKIGMHSAEMTRYEQEYDRRGRWTRAFIVTNANGHVHSSMNCSTCRPTTRYAWVTDYSGKSEEEIVSAAGERACTTCYPSAPVDVRNSPTRIFTPEERERQQAREERARAREEREQARASKAVTAPDGSELKLAGRWGEVIRTETTARSRYVEILAEDRLRAEGIIDYHLPETEENRSILSEALSRKNNMTVEEYNASIESKVATKIRAMRREWGR